MLILENNKKKKNHWRICPERRVFAAVSCSDLSRYMEWDPLNLQIKTNGSMYECNLFRRQLQVNLCFAQAEQSDVFKA